VCGLRGAHRARPLARLGQFGQSFEFEPGERPDPGFAVLTGVLSLALQAVGALIASRLPTNPIGWIFCATGLLYVAQRFTIAYADYALLDTFGLSWGESAAWFRPGYGSRTQLS
jgi:hypothetical protein